MGWFGDSINERCLVNEGDHKIWSITLSSDTWIDLSIYRVDGYGPTLYVIPDYEYRNFQQGLTFTHIPNLHLVNIEEFSRRSMISRGKYYIVVLLPSIPDGMNSYSEFNIRYEVVK